MEEKEKEGEEERVEGRSELLKIGCISHDQHGKLEIEGKLTPMNHTYHPHRQYYDVHHTSSHSGNGKEINFNHFNI